MRSSFEQIKVVQTGTEIHRGKVGAGDNALKEKRKRGTDSQSDIDN